MALQAAGYWVLASMHISRAFFRSALSSTKVWHFPSACPMTGILVCSIQYLTNPLEPRGMRRSTYFSAFRSTSTSSWLSMPMIQDEEKEKEEVASLIRAISFLLVLVASFPPLRIRPLPLIKESPAIWIRASGLASKIIPITPMGNVFFSRIKSGSSSLFSLIFPIGSGSLDSSTRPVIEDEAFSSPKERRWRIEEGIPSSLAFSTSFLFSEKIASSSLFNISLMALRALRLSSIEEEASAKDAFLTDANESKRSSIWK